jgi:hypothetical protein
MEKDSFFEGMTPKVGEFAKFNKVGDSVQGTYIDRRDGVDGYGNDQFIYTLQSKDGKIHNVGVKKTSINLIRQMEMVPFGFIVGFRFDEERENKKNPKLHATKIINAYYNLKDPKNPKYVDLEWMEGQKTIGRNSFTADNTKNPPLPVEAGADDFEEFLEETVDQAPGSDGMDSVRKLAKTKGLVDKDVSDADANEIIAAFTGVAMEKGNMKDIVVALTKFKK